MQSIYSLPDWYFGAILELDVHQPGLVGRVLRASAERRHVIAAYLAKRLGQQVKAAEARFLLSAGHRDILAQAFGNHPSGLRWALSRSGSVPHEPDYYLALLNMLTSANDSGRKAGVIRDLDAISPDRLAIIDLLPAALLHVHVVSALADVGAAKDLIGAVQMMAQRGVDPAELAAAMVKAKDRTALSKTMARWAERIRFPDPPIAACWGYEPVPTGRHLKAIALRYRNCARVYLTDAIRGELAFGELTVGSSSVLLAFRRSGGFWRLDDVYTVRNRPVQQDLVTAAESFARPSGTPSPLPRRVVFCRFSA